MALGSILQRLWHILAFGYAILARRSLARCRRVVMTYDVDRLFGNILVVATM